MGNEIRASVDRGTTGNYVLIVNPENPAQAWDTNAGAWAAYDSTDADQKVSLGGSISFGSLSDWQFADLPSGLSVSQHYIFDAFNSDEDWIGTGTIGRATTPYAKDDVKGPRVWTWPKNSNRIRSPAIVRVHPSFNGTLAFDVTNLLNKGAGILEIESVTVSPSGPAITGPNDTATPAKSSDNRKILFDIDGGQAAATDYTFTCTFSTTDSDDVLVHTGLMESRST